MGHMNSLYRELLHVPLIIWAPGRVPAGMRIEQPVTTAALPATLLEMIDGKQSAQFRGPSLVSLWKGKGIDQSWPDPLSDLAEMAINPRFPNFEGALQSVTTSEWQYIVGGKNGAELYHFKSDPEETKNLIGSEPGRREAVALQRELPMIQKLMQQRGLGVTANAIVAVPSGQASTPEERKRADQLLRSLGYAN
jgi:uncharacterized sulfatase